MTRWGGTTRYVARPRTRRFNEHKTNILRARQALSPWMSKRHLQAQLCFMRTAAYETHAGRARAVTNMNNEAAPTRVSYELTSSSGTPTRIHIRPSYPHKPKAVQNLLNPETGLPSLLTEVGMPLSSIKSFTTHGWDLDEHGDAIHRYIHIRDLVQQQRVFDGIKEEAKTLNHDPHIDSSRNGHITITCTTHSPPGLSMKDVHLARAVSGILDGVVEIAESDTAEPQSVRGGLEADIFTLRQRGRERNRAAIEEAKKSCNCG